jgi:hypothetical protein
MIPFTAGPTALIRSRMTCTWLFYVRNKRQACVAAGMRDLHRYLPAGVAHGDAAALLDELAADRTCPASLLHLLKRTPLPLSSWPKSRVPPQT